MGWRDIYKFGSGAGIGSVPTIICTTSGVGGANSRPAAPGALTIVSSSTDDDVGQSGSTEVKVWGLRGSPGSTYEDSATYTLDGTTPVAGWADAFRIYRMRATAGGDNVGNIDALIGGTVAMRVLPGDGQTTTSMFSVPDGSLSILRAVRGSVLKSSGPASRVVISVAQRPFGGPSRLVACQTGLQTDGGGNFEYAFAGVGAVFEGGGLDIWMAVTDLGGSTTVDAFGGYDMRVKYP